MYGSITVPGGLGLPSGEVDQETQARLAALLKGLTAEMDITGSARRLAQAVTIALEGAVSGSVAFDGSEGVTIQTVNNQLPIVGNITLTAEAAGGMAAQKYSSGKANTSNTAGPGFDLGNAGSGGYDGYASTHTPDFPGSTGSAGRGSAGKAGGIGGVVIDQAAS
ncbi:MAG: hypothetical protein HFE44_07905 [Oscillospiraceae bacterium]|jgi:hypothetical protein|nr:hypothetical protein [Oscillospiraceae bacterium]